MQDGINKCRPYLVCCLGELNDVELGPESVNASILHENPWLKVDAEFSVWSSPDIYDIAWQNLAPCHKPLPTHPLRKLGWKAMYVPSDTFRHLDQSPRRLGINRIFCCRMLHLYLRVPQSCRRVVASSSLRPACSPLRTWKCSPPSFYLCCKKQYKVVKLVTICLRKRTP